MSSESKPQPPDSRWSTSEVQAFLDCLEEVLPEIATQAAEDERSFTFRVAPCPPDQAGDWLRALSPHADKGDVRLDLTLAEGLQGALSLQAEERLRVEPALERDEDLYVEPEDAALARTLDEWAGRLARRRATVAIDALEGLLDACEQGGVAVELALTLAVNKGAWQQKLLGPAVAANVVLFLYPGPFLSRLERMSLVELGRDWFREAKQPAIWLVLGARGYLEGDYVACFGLDALPRVAGWLARPREADHLEKVHELRDKAGFWNGKPDVLTPDHFLLQSRGWTGEGAAEIEAELQVMAVQLATGFLANRTDTRTEPPLGRFDGHKTCRVPMDRAAWRALIRGEGLAAGPLLALYRWTYENYSADQVGVVQRLAAAELDPGPEGNARALLTGAGKMLETARHNLQQLVRQNIGEVFAARNQVCEFLRAYTDEIGQALSDLTGELVGNLYKTLAAIIAAIIAAELTQKPAAVVLVTALLYFGYVAFIIVYVLPSIWLKYRLKKKEYETNVTQFVKKDVLLKEDIERFQGETYRDAERQFTGYFVATLGVYVLLAAVALGVAVVYGVRLVV